MIETKGDTKSNIDARYIPFGITYIRFYVL